MQPEEGNNFRPYVEWCDLSWELSKLSIPERSETVLQEGMKYKYSFYRHYAIRNLYLDLENEYEMFTHKFITAAQLVAHCSRKISVHIENFDRFVSNWIL